MPHVGVMYRWKMEGKAVALNSMGMPELLGFIAFWAKPPVDVIDKNGNLQRKYGQWQRRSLADGTPLQSIESVTAAFLELRALAQSMPASARRMVGTATGNLTEVITTVSGVQLYGDPEKVFEPEELTFGALIRRVEEDVDLLTTNAIYLRQVKNVMGRGLEESTRYDKLTRQSWNSIYKEVQKFTKADGTPIAGNTQNMIFRALRWLMDQAVSEASIPDNLADRVKLRKSRGTRTSPPAATLTMTQARRLEWCVIRQAAMAELFIAGGKTPIRPVTFSKYHSTPYNVVQGTVSCPGQKPLDLDFGLASYGGAALVEVFGHKYFAAGLKAMVLLFSQMAPRPGEVRALCRDQIDWNERTVKWTSHAQSFAGKIGSRALAPTLDGTKMSSAGRLYLRSPYMTDEVRAALHDWLAVRDVVTRTLKWVLPQADRGGLVFPSIEGKMMDVSMMTRYFHAMERVAGVPLAAPNQCRHTMESSNHALQVVPDETAESQGHSLDTARRFYTKAQRAQLRLVATMEEEKRRRLDAGVGEEWLYTEANCKQFGLQTDFEFGDLATG